MTVADLGDGRVREVHRCGDWDVIPASGWVRCGLTFGDGKRCTVMYAEAPSEVFAEHTYRRPPEYTACKTCGHAARHATSNVVHCDGCRGPCLPPGARY